MSSGTSRISFNTMPLFFSRSSSFSWSAAQAGAERVGRTANTVLKRHVINFFMSLLLVSEFSRESLLQPQRTAGTPRFVSTAHHLLLLASSVLSSDSVSYRRCHKLWPDRIGDRLSQNLIDH